jgi:SH3-like domain-containing protein
VVGALGDCEAGWCELDVAGREGWVRAERLWGAGEP